MLISTCKSQAAVGATRGILIAGVGINWVIYYAESFQCISCRKLIGLDLMSIRYGYFYKGFAQSKQSVRLFLAKLSEISMSR